MSGYLGEVLAGIDGKENSYTLTIDAGWLQGRSAFGGLSVALLTRAMRLHVGRDVPVRSLLTSFVGPIGAGDVVLQVETLRQGKNVTHMSARALQDGKIGTIVNAVFGADRESFAVPAMAESRAEPRDSVPQLPDLPILPSFLSKFDIHWTGPGQPMSGKKDRRTGMWIRCRDGMDDFRIERMIALADAPPPVTLSWKKELMMASSVTWSLEFVRQPATVTGDWFYLDYDLEAADHGYSQQAGKVFDEAGNLVLVGRQCMAYFG